LRELREIRLRRGLSQADLSAVTGVAEFTISEIESGKRANPRPSTLRKLAQALGVEVADLYGELDSPLGEAPPSQEKLFNGLEGEQRAKLEEAERAVQYITGRAQGYEQELERGRAHLYNAADRAYVLAILAIEEFSSFNRWFFDVAARDLVREIENGNAPELVDEFDLLEEAFIERISRTQRVLLDNASRLAETQDQRDDLARRRKTSDSNIKSRRHSA
jgi:transcriptional regulator with XRE-family HTH domain